MPHRAHTSFENDVKTYGTETKDRLLCRDKEFENDVKTYGTETENVKYSTDDEV